MPVEATRDERERLFDSVVGTVTLRVSDLDSQRDLYALAIGLEARDDGPDRAHLVKSDGQALLALDSSTARGSDAPPRRHTGLFHNAFRYPDRKTLAAAVIRTADATPVFEGASDHGVSEAIYFRDAEGNGIELYRDRPYDEWPPAEDGGVTMYTRPLDVRALLAEAEEPSSPGRVDIGHIHLQTRDVEAAAAFWRDVVGLDERQRYGPQAIFLAEGLYHHHLGANTWHSADADPLPPELPGLDGFELRLRSRERVDAAAARLEESGLGPVAEDGAVTVTDPDGSRVQLTAR